MLLKSILNRVQRHQSFVYGTIHLVQKAAQLILEIQIQARKGSKAICSGCGSPRPGYDSLSVRRFEFVPLWGISVFFLYAMRRVDCPVCGIIVEQVPWASGKSHLTTTYSWFLARWGRRLSWKETAEVFQTSWDSVFRSVKMAVEWGLAHRVLDNITAIGIDEIAWRKVKEKFLTLVYQIDAGRCRLLWIGESRTKKTLEKFFEEFGAERSARLKVVCTDMWKPYLDVVARYAAKALNVLDRFHIMMHMNKAIDKVRAKEVRELKVKGQEAYLTNSRWCLLKRVENLTENQAVRLKDVVAINLKTVRAYLLKEVFDQFWQYKRAAWAGQYLDSWCRRVMRSRLKPMKAVAKMLRAHRELILNWFRTKEDVALGAVEGLNNKAKVTSKKAYGFRSYGVIKVALYHTLGNLPEPKGTHRFC